MLTFDVPFIADGDYLAFLASLGDRLTTVHIPLDDEGLSNARQWKTSNTLETVAGGLTKLTNVSKFALMNSRIHAPDKYFDAEQLARTAALLDQLKEQCDLRGVIFADAYYLRALSEASPKTTQRLEAIPSINTGITSAEGAFALFRLIETTGFQPPSSLVLDRCLNRDFKRLQQTADGIRDRNPDILLYLLANEGCLTHCPFKPAHDAHIAMSVEGLCAERTFAMNRNFGCVRMLMDDPGAMLASPFIRPEDTGKYEGIVDGLKICGRTRGVDFLTRTLKAYARGSYQGNLLDLMDTMGDLADRVSIPNESLPDDFFERVTRCDKDCRSCGWCGKVMDRIGRVSSGADLPLA